jgi:hypothetical protein
MMARHAATADCLRNAEEKQRQKHLPRKTSQNAV